MEAQYDENQEPAQMAGNWEGGSDNAVEEDQMLINEDIEELQEDMQKEEEVQAFFYNESPKLQHRMDDIVTNFSSGYAKHVPVSFLLILTLVSM